MRKVLRENWLTRPSLPGAGFSTLLLSLTLVSGALLHFASSGQLGWAASGEAVFQGHAWWRLWAALFAHADFGHLASNLLLFIPLSYLLSAHYRAWLWPSVLGAGLVNAVVLTTMPSQASLLGVSGLVYWMGATWLTLYLLVDRRDKWRRRFGHALFITLVLFVPETIKPEVSHFSHFLGFVGGALFGAGYYLVSRDTFQKAERWEEVCEPFFAEQLDQASSETEPFFELTSAGESCQKISAEQHVMPPMHTKVE
jgi:rhomboid protease GluP